MCIRDRSMRGFIVECDRAWRAAILPWWKERHEILKEAHEAVATETESPETLTDEHLLTRADSFVELGKDSEARPLYELVSTRNGEDARAAYALGATMLRLGDLGGIQHLSRAMQNDWRYVVPACEIVYPALREKGLDKDAEAWVHRYDQQQEILAAAQAEWNSLLPSDNLELSEISETTRNFIIEKCREAGWVGRVWIARKKLLALPTTIDFVAVRARMFALTGTKRFQKFVDSLASDQELMVFLVESGAIMRKLDRIGARAKLR